MRAFFLCLIFAALAGCTSLIRQGSDGFEASGVSPERFEADNDACRIQSDDYLAYELRGMTAGTRYEKNRAYNSVYGGCMRARGYRPRPYIKNLLPG
jgi:hypothetical protein